MPSSVVTLYLRSSLNSSHMSRIWLVVSVLDHGLLYPPSAECSLTIISSDKLSHKGHRKKEDMHQLA